MSNVYVGGLEIRNAVSKDGDDIVGTLTFPTDDFTISTPPIVFRFPNLSDDESSKGGIIEWGAVMDGASHAYGISTYAYQQDSNATFTAPSGYKKWAWVTTHFDSPASTEEDIHQHFNIETVKADWTTAITRFQISFGEDVTLTSFPNTHVKVYNDLNFQIGTDAAGAYLKHDTSAARIIVSGSTPWNFTESKVKIGTAGSPASRLHVEESTDAVCLTIKNTLASANGAAMLLMQNGTAGATAIQTGLTGEGVNRYSMNTSGRMDWGSGSATRDTNLYRTAADKLKTDDMFIATIGIGVGNSASGSSLGTVVRKMEVFDATGSSLGFVPIYNSIT